MKSLRLKNRHTRRNKSNNTKEFKIKIQCGGQDPVEAIQNAVKDDNNLSSILQNNIKENLENIIKGMLIKSVEFAGKVAKANLFDKDDTNNQLKKFLIVITDEGTKQKIKTISKEFLDYIVIILEASAPFAKTLIDNYAEIAAEAMGKVGDAGVKVVMNTMTEIPGLGVLIGSLRSMNSMGSAFVSVVNAGSEAVKHTADSTNGFLKNLKRLENKNLSVSAKLPMTNVAHLNHINPVGGSNERRTHEKTQKKNIVELQKEKRKIQMRINLSVGGFRAG